MSVFTVVAGSLLFGFGALLMMMSIEATSLCPSWDELKKAFRIIANRPKFWIGAVCVVIGFLMIVGLLFSLIR